MIKKYLIAGALALICNGVLTSCSEDLSKYSSLEEEKKVQFAENFEKFYGKISPTQDWGFGDASISAARAITRGQGDNSCGTCIKPDMDGYPSTIAPAAITDAERAYVKEWFETHPGFTEGINVNNFFVQHVWGQANKDYNVYWNVYDQNYQQNHPGAASNYYRNDFVTQATMDYFCVGDGTSYTHTLDFNANDVGTTQKIVYMQNSSALSFKYHSSWSSEEFNFFKCAEIDVPGVGKGWYVGLCCYGEKYDNGEQKLNYDQKVSEHADDWIVKIVPGSGSAITTNKTTKVYKKKTVLVHKWVFCEDLGSSSNMRDLDYNDLVFDAQIIDECKVLRDADNNEIAYPDDPSHKYYALVTPLAAGGELLIKFNDLQETIHGMFVPATANNVLINTCRFDTDYVLSHVEGLAATTGTISFASADDASIDNIVVMVRSSQAAYSLEAYKGEAPHKICVPVGTRWPYELTNISMAYTGFENYVQGGDEPWATTGAEENLYPLDGVAYDMKTDKTGSVSYEEVSSSSTTEYSYTLADAAYEHVWWDDVTGSTKFYTKSDGNWDGNVSVSSETLAASEIGNGTIIRFYFTSENGYMIKVTDNNWGDFDLGNTGWDQNFIQGNAKNGYVEFKLNTTTANRLKDNGLLIYGTGLTALALTCDNSEKVADEEPETPSASGDLLTWTGSIVFGPYNLKSGNAFIDCSFNFDDLSNSPKIEVEFTRDNPENSWEPTDYYLKVCTQNGTAITSQISDSDGLSDADGKSHSSAAGTSFREVFTVSSSIMPTWRQHYNDWNQKQIQLQGKNITITKVTIQN